MGFADIHRAAFGTLASGGAFGESIQYQPAAGGDLAVRGIFGAPYEEADPNGIEVQTTLPTIGVSLPELALLGVTPAQGDRVVVRGDTWLVADVQVDGEGWARLPLHQVEVP